VTVSDHALHILIVDDEDIIQSTLGDFFSQLGHQTYHALDGNEGLVAIETRSYDLALVDVRMPGLDGIELLTRARQIRPKMPVIIVTGHGDPTMSEKALELGALEFLIKPIRLRDLIKILDRLGGRFPESRNATPLA
jgi:DNA-binding NtrC family response regulator